MMIAPRLSPWRSSNTIAFFASATSTATTATMPSSIAANDVAILVNGAFDADASPPASVYPSGWTAIGSSVSADLSSGGISGRANVSYKILAGSESGSTITGMNGSNSEYMVILVFRPSAGTWGTPSSVNAVMADADPADQTVTVGSAPGLVIGWVVSDGVALDITMNPSQDAFVSAGSPDLRVGYIVYNSGPSNNTVSSSITYGGLGSFWFPLT